MRAYFVLLVLCLACCQTNTLQTSLINRHLQSAQESTAAEGQVHHQTATQQKFTQDQKEHPEEGHQNMRTKGTIVVLVGLLLFLIAKKCFEGRKDLNQQKYTKHKTNQKEMECHPSQVSQECPIILAFDIETIKSKYLVQNYGPRCSKLTASACPSSSSSSDCPPIVIQ